MAMSEDKTNEKIKTKIVIMLRFPFTFSKEKHIFAL